MGSLNADYTTKECEHTTHKHTPHGSTSPVSINRAMKLPLKLVLQSGKTGWVTTRPNAQTGVRCGSFHDDQVPLACQLNEKFRPIISLLWMSKMAKRQNLNRRGNQQANMNMTNNTTTNKTRVFCCFFALVLLLRHSWTELAVSAAVPDSSVWLQAWICPW